MFYQSIVNATPLLSVHIDSKSYLSCHFGKLWQHFPSNAVIFPVIFSRKHSIVYHLLLRLHPSASGTKEIKHLPVVRYMDKGILRIVIYSVGVLIVFFFPQKDFLRGIDRISVKLCKNHISRHSAYGSGPHPDNVFIVGIVTLNAATLLYKLP